MALNNSASYITDYGGGGKVIILLHGFLSSSAYWRRLQPRLSTAGFRVITIDLLGFGRAPKPVLSIYNYREHVAHIDDAIASLNLTEPFILTGHSMGALLAMRFAHNSSHRIASLVLLHPPLYATAEQAYKVLRSTGVHYRFLLDSKFRSLVWGIIRFVPIGGVMMRHNKQSRENSLKNVIEVAESLKDLKQIRTKTLLILGLKDREEYLNNIRTASFSKKVVLQIEAVGHHSPVRKAELISQKIYDFAYIS